MQSQAGTLFFQNEKLNLMESVFDESAKRKITFLYTNDIEMDGRTIEIDNKKYINFASCSYLSIEHDERIKKAVVRAVERFGASFLMSRIYASSPQFDEFEQLMAQLTGAYPVITSTTTLGHISALPVFIQKNDLVLIDMQVHNSVQTAAKTVDDYATLKFVSHNNMEQLESVIKRNKDKYNKIWYLADGIYSMHGDTCDIHNLIKLLDTYDNFYTYIDDAHGMSIHGKHGRGFILGHQEKLHPKMIVALSLSKCFGMGCGGAIVLPNAEWQKKLRYCGSSLIFSSPLPAPMLGAGIASANIHLSDEITQMQKQLHDLRTIFYKKLEEVGIKSISSILSPMIYIPIGGWERTFDIAEKLFKKGFFLNPVTYPAVSNKHSGIRITLTLKHQIQDLANLANELAELLLLNR